MAKVYFAMGCFISNLLQYWFLSVD